VRTIAPVFVSIYDCMYPVTRELLKRANSNLSAQTAFQGTDDIRYAYLVRKREFGSLSRFATGRSIGNEEKIGVVILICYYSPALQITGRAIASVMRSK
jgi:hypothetical protein